MAIRLHPYFQALPGWNEMAEYASRRMTRCGLDFEVFIRPPTKKERQQFLKEMLDETEGASVKYDLDKKYVEMVFAFDPADPDLVDPREFAEVQVIDTLWQLLEPTEGDDE